MRRRLLKKLTVTGLLILSISGLTGCSGVSFGTSTVVGQAEKKPVGIMQIKTQKMATISELSGTLEPFQETILSFEVAGKIQELIVREGDNVLSGQLLARLDTTDYALKLSLANTDVSSAEATLAKVKNGARAQEKAQVKTALEAKSIDLDHARKDYNRMDQLFKSGAVTQAEYENAKKVLDLAQKDYDSAKEKYSLVIEGTRIEDIAATQANYQTAVVARSQAASLLEKTQLKSPITGTIISKMVEEGQLADAGTAVYRVGNINFLKTVLPVPDKEIGSWAVGDTVEISLYGQKRTGKVSKIYPATNQQSGTIGVEVIIDNQKHNWFAGQVVSAKRILTQTEGIFIPTDAVMSRGSEPFVFLVIEGKAVKTPVILGRFINSHFEITTGLKAGDRVIVNGADRLLDGDTVTVQGGE
ncbi:efflux RND transporter periplasmic adaptor subunit [Brevibacillus laterosporus]|uniref:efflux RND transporter periplasmic adaptor subunit n=1 Tax=Brevibacillus laterosporus TaxID=1465 RepID=UPI002654ACD7|nr:efflux RND transporter periplasmic adaptor subunit [Brevibacillus laterosporus]MDN9012713.1 efflux RND transporter periplasmic adaptor subunit [Brevibacillus laterosporus]MDO0943802.1 efflux RND transporter periplasmic adaptor subunit [Brevibacillus laterosporus]